MTVVLVAVPAVVLVLAWLADARARRIAWQNIARARRAAHRPEECPHCRAAVATPDERWEDARRGDTSRPAA